MIAQQKAAPAGSTARGEAKYQKQPAHLTKTKPAFGNFFAPGEGNTARVIAGWPLRRPPARNVVGLPPGTDPRGIDWRQLRGCHVLAAPPEGSTADHQLLRELGAELVAAGVASLILFDGTAVVSEFWRAGSERPGAPHE